jgi:hypothetical protein
VYLPDPEEASRSGDPSDNPRGVALKAGIAECQMDHLPWTLGSIRAP